MKKESKNLSRASKTTSRSLLPINYQEARVAISRCVKIDECKDWADKALALKSYAKQANDHELEDKAQRIRDRAIQRGGELLKQIKPEKGGRPKTGALGGMSSRKAAAKKAGIKPKQMTQMLRVANVPEEQFEEKVEASPPATVKELAELGTIKNKRVEPEPFRNEYLDWTQAVRHLASLPHCGLAVLAKRDPYRIAELVDECQQARSNLEQWHKELTHEQTETVEVSNPASSILDQ